MWDTIAQPVVETIKGVGKAESPQQCLCLSPLGCGCCLCHQGYQKTPYPYSTRALAPPLPHPGAVILSFCPWHCTSSHHNAPARALSCACGAGSPFPGAGGQGLALCLPLTHSALASVRDTSPLPLPTCPHCLQFSLERAPRSLWQ